MFYCPKCGSGLKEYRKFCTFCGAKLEIYEDKIRKVTNDPPQDDNPPKKIIPSVSASNTKDYYDLFESYSDEQLKEVLVSGEYNNSAVIAANSILEKRQNAKKKTEVEDRAFYKRLYQDYTDEQLYSIGMNTSEYTETEREVAKGLLSERKETEEYRESFKAYSDEELQIIINNQSEYTEAALQTAKALLNERKLDRIKKASVIKKEQTCTMCGKQVETIRDEFVYGMRTIKICGRCRSLISHYKTFSDARQEVDNNLGKLDDDTEQIIMDHYAEYILGNGSDSSSKKQSVKAVSKKLWSWLKQTSNRQILHSNVELNKTEYMEKLRMKLEDNGVSASIKPITVTWDENSTAEYSYYTINPSTKVSNPFTYLLLLNSVGKYKFVEVKSYITPPDLPEKPLKPVPVPEGGSVMMIFIGVLMTIYGIMKALMDMADYGSSNSLSSGFSMIILCVGIVIATYSMMKYNSRQEALLHNEKCRKQELAWNNAWDTWERNIFNHGFQENVNGELSRAYDAIFDCVNTLNKEMFPNSEMTEDKEVNNRNQLEAAIARRKAEYR